ncbi:MAG: TonB-dependent receptor [Ignavibacteriales bacterium]|nr:TonB-dependent receptor [Ignavibacteriales bacterium]
MKKILFFTLLLMSVILSQNASSLEIVVRDAGSKEVLQGAVIKFENLPFGGVTDVTGRFFLRSIPAGEWRVICSFVGYKTIKQTITIGEEINQSEILMYNDQVQVPEIIVTGTRAEDKGSSSTYSNLDKLEIERISVNRDIPSILNQLPSTSFYSESGTGIGYGYIRIRGFDQRRISVLINGVPQNDPEDHSVYWINFYDLANSLEDLQVQRGSSLSFYGPPAIGASINLVTTKPFVEPGVSFEAGMGSYNTKKYAINANSGLIADRFMIKFRGSKVTSDGYRDWSWSEFYRFFVTASYFDDNQTISLSAYGGPQEDGLAFYGISKSQNGDEQARKYNYGASSRDREVLNQPQVSLVHDLKLSDKVWLKTHSSFCLAMDFSILTRVMEITIILDSIHKLPFHPM